MMQYLFLSDLNCNLCTMYSRMQIGEPAKGTNFTLEKYNVNHGNAKFPGSTTCQLKFLV